MLNSDISIDVREQISLLKEMNCYRNSRIQIQQIMSAEPVYHCHEFDHHYDNVKLRIILQMLTSYSNHQS